MNLCCLCCDCLSEFFLKISEGGKLESRPAVPLSASSRGRWVQGVIYSENMYKNNSIYFTHEALS